MSLESTVKMTDAAGENATMELIARLRAGENYQSAREIVERQYLLLPPETSETDTEE